MVMTKRDLLDDLRASHPEFSRAQMTRLIDDFFQALAASLKANGEVRITDFGTFVVRESAARIGKNPQTGQPLTVAARKVARFRPAKALKEKLNEKPKARVKKAPSAPNGSGTPGAS